MFHCAVYAMLHSLLIIVLVLGMFLFPAVVAALDEEPLASEQEQVIAPSVVRQGDFALRLAQAFNLPISEDEAEAASALATLGIQPAAGWVADQPMTPQAVAELRDAVVLAATAGRLVMGEDAAMRVFTDLVAEFELPLPAAPAPGYTSGGTPTTAYGPDCNGTALDYYYGNYGTPIYSYCPPPPAYYYLYYWVPYDFYWHQYVFTGFFVRKHFDGIPHAQHGDHRHRVKDGHDGKKHDHERPPHSRVWQADPTLQPRAIVTPGIGNSNTPGIGRRDPPGNRVWTKDDTARRWIAPTASGNPSAPPVTGRAHTVLPWHKTSRPPPARSGATPTPPVAVPHMRRSVNHETPQWSSSVSRGAAAR